MRKSVNQKTIKFIKRVKELEDKKLREDVWNQMSFLEQDVINKIIKKSLTLISKKS
jgi:hypothetical protein